jgi:GNAT superfamily N-acetyltransferase
MVEFKKFGKYQEGIIFSLLSRSYEAYFQYDPKIEAVWKQAWGEYDQSVFENPEMVGASGFISSIDGCIIGFASWDPRQYPCGIIGHNCVLPEFRGKGFGALQIKEVLRILKDSGFRKVVVTTGAHKFFQPAQKMYNACGFEELDRGFADKNSLYGTVTFEHALE